MIFLDWSGDQMRKFDWGTGNDKRGLETGAYCHDEKN
jgi:hypothetical protein